MSLTEAGSGTEKGVHLLSGLRFADRWKYFLFLRYHTSEASPFMQCNAGWSESIYPSDIFHIYSFSYTQHSYNKEPRVTSETSLEINSQIHGSYYFVPPVAYFRWLWAGEEMYELPKLVHRITHSELYTLVLQRSAGYLLIFYVFF